MKNETPPQRSADVCNTAGGFPPPRLPRPRAAGRPPIDSVLHRSAGWAAESMAPPRHQGSRARQSSFGDIAEQYRIGHAG